MGKNRMGRRFNFHTILMRNEPVFVIYNADVLVDLHKYDKNITFLRGTQIVVMEWGSKVLDYERVDFSMKTQPI